MPFYELILVLKPMPKKEVVDCLKRAAKLIWDNDGVIKKLDYMGFNKLPYSAKAKDQECAYKEANHFLFYTSLRTDKMFNLRSELKLDLDILQSHYDLPESRKLPADYVCTLEEELLPPIHRASVKPLLEEKNVRADVRR